jgi:site-specific DNA-methyltransferase (adenine-specific)
MGRIGRPYAHHADRPATTAERVRVHRLKRQASMLQSARPPELLGGSSLRLDLPPIPCRTFGSYCTVYCCDCQVLYRFLPSAAAVVSDPPYDGHYDATKARRGASQWERNFEGYDRPFDPRPWLRFPEVILCGADHYSEHLPPGAWCRWNKTQGKAPGDFADHEMIWLSMPGQRQVFDFLWRGGMRAGRANWTRRPQKYHPAEKPEELMLYLVKQTTAAIIIDPFMGSGTTGVACIELRRPFIGIEIDAEHFEKACKRLQEEVGKWGWFA